MFGWAGTSQHTANGGRCSKRFRSSAQRQQRHTITSGCCGILVRARVCACVRVRARVRVCVHACVRAFTCSKAAVVFGDLWLLWDVVRHIKYTMPTIESAVDQPTHILPGGSAFIVWYLRACGAKIGKNCCLYPNGFRENALMSEATPYI